ncbi:MAG: fibronectin type III domain-containing protein, partial [bacterium]|nr:fibronectin type III domain-containing protein [bacterium]
ASADSAYSGAASLMASPDTNIIITLNGLASGTAYNYRLTARDVYGNTGRENQIRTFTTASDTAAPVITFNSTTGIVATSTTATITWTTSEPATGRVDYGETISYGSNVADADTTNTDHVITLTGLTAGTSYYYKLTSADAAGNPRVDDNTGAGYTFTTAPIIPIIDASPVATKTSTTATITWTTNNVKSSSFIDFGTTLSYGTTQGNSSYLVTSHEVNLVGLTPGTAYKYRIKSVDVFGNTVTDDNSGAGYTFTTDSLAASGAVPGISSVYSESITSSSAVIRWTTAESSDSLVGYGIVSGAYKFETGSSGQSTIHAVALTGLSPSTTYYYRVKSRTAANRLETGEDAAYTFTTLAGTEKIPPVISGISVSSATSNKATIAWTTDENSSSLVDFGTAAGVYTSTQGNPADSTGAHSVEVKSLTPSTVYYFRVRSVDASGNSASATGDGFSTTAGAAVDCPATGSSRPSCPEPEVCPTADKAAPKITNIKISDIAFNTATVSWETDENANSMIVYDTVSEGVKKVFNYSAGQSKDAVKLHTVILRGLDSNTPYYFKASSADSSGNTADSDQQTFTTLSITQAKDKGSATAESLKKQFEDIAKTLVKDNLATEENIKDIISRIANPPLISQEGPIVKDIKSYGATIYWQTDRKSNSVVKFTANEDKDKPLSVGSNWREISKTDTYDTRHEVSLLGLAPSTTYSFQVLSRDVLGNIASSEIKSFTTSSSSSIFNVAITNLGLTAATINWETANLSTTTLEWGLESTYGNYKDKGEEKVKKHNISIDNLSSGTTYHYRVRSVEEAGSILVSDDYTFITPELPQITKYSLGEVKDNAVSL